MLKESFYNIWHNNYLFNSLHRTVLRFLPEEVDVVKKCLASINDDSYCQNDIIRSLIKMGFICDSELNEYEFVKFKNKLSVYGNRECRLTINPTLQCNYSCWYCCVEDQGTQYQHRCMDEETIDKVKKLIKNLVVNNKIDRLHLDWFGGEPLMYFEEVVKPISLFAMNLCNRSNMPFSNHVTTNAYYITDEMINDFNTIKLKGFQIPVDGNEQKHNSVKFMGNQGHLQKILKSVNSIAKQVKDSHIILRINYDNETLDSVSEIIPSIAVENRDKITVDFQRVWQVHMNTSSDGNNQKLLYVKNNFEEEGFATTYFAYEYKPFRCCYADSLYHWVINYDGKVFKCSARNYDESLIAGKIDDHGNLLFNPIVYDFFSKSSLDNNRCRECKLLPLCYGLCIQKQYEYTKKNKPFQCLHDFSEISLGYFIEQLFEKRMKFMHKKNNDV